jgi:ribosomal protein S18 acetylase RimI-like enzyme
MVIEPTVVSDLDGIFRIYDAAIVYQKKYGNNHWLGFSEEMVKKEIEEQRHFKIISNYQLMGTFVYTLSDPLIWKAANDTPAIYIHRIATGPEARGNNLVGHIVNWAKAFAKERQLQFVRIDTGSGNERLIGHYINCGFTFLGDTTVDYTPDLPLHYQNGKFALLEMPVS